MNKETFKAGDEVYCPAMGEDIFVLDIDSYHRASSEYPLSLRDSTFTTEGLRHTTDKVPYIFHATPENKDLLEALYKCEFESPKLKGSDLTRKLLSEGKHVLCWLNDRSDEECFSAIGIISRLKNGKFVSQTGNYWKYAVPCADYANLPDGILELNND